MKCTYCGEFEGTIEIPSPNANEHETWHVCPTCEKVIQEQQGLSMAMRLKMMTERDLPNASELIQDLDKKIEAHKKQIEYLAKESDMPVLSVAISKRE